MVKCSHPDLAPIYCPSKWLVNQWGCQVWECHDTTPDPPITTPAPTPVPSNGTGEDVGAEIGFSVLGILLVLMFGLGIFALCRRWGGRFSCFMREQTNTRSIQWRIDCARARLLRNRISDFFNRSEAQFETARLEESTYGASEYAAIPSPSFWSRFRSGIQKPFATRQAPCETPRRGGVTRPCRNLYGTEPVASNSNSEPQNSGGVSFQPPPLPARNFRSTNSRGVREDCLITFDDNNHETIELASLTKSNVTGQSDGDYTSHWSTALGASPDDPAVVRVTFNPNDQDSAVVLESNGVTGQAEATNSSNVANGNNAVTGGTSRLFTDSNLGFLEDRLKKVGGYLYCELQNVREAFTGTKKRTVSLDQEESTDNASVAASVDSSDPSILISSQFLEQHMSEGSTMEIPESTGLAFSNWAEQNSPYKSPGSPRAQSSPNGSISSASSDGDNNVTVQELPTGQSLVEQAAPGELASLSAAHGENEFGDLADLSDRLANAFGPPAQLQNSIPAADALSPVRQAPSPPPGAVGAIPKQRQKKVWPPKSSPYNLRDRNK